MKVLSNIRKKKVFRFVAAFLAMNMLAQIVSPTVAWALTSGPSQPEFQSFEPAGTSDMVDLFSGDFNYNIPLFDLPGPDGSYPFNIAYHSGIGMDQEASWVGLGWNINPGAINHDKRGLSDDFCGETINTEMDIKPNVTYGITTGTSLEIWGGDLSFGASMGITIYNNSYKGIGYTLDQGFSLSSDNAALNLGLSLDSQEGVGANADVSFSKTMSNKNKEKSSGSIGIGAGFNSQRGLDISVSGSFSNQKESKGKKTGRAAMSGTSTYSFADKAYMPAFTTPMEGFNLQTAIKMGADLGGVFGEFTLGGFYREDKVKNINNDYAAYGYNYLESAVANNALMDFNREKDGVIRKESPNLPIPILTYDTYMALGQGFLGSYRAHRSDVGHLHDPFVESSTLGGSIGVDLGLGYPFHLGIAGSVNSTTMTSGDWTENNSWNNNSGVDYKYLGGSQISKHNYENVYYKMKGEPTSFDTDELDFIGGELAVRATFEKHGSFLDVFYNAIDGVLQPSSGDAITVATDNRGTRERIARNNSIQPITTALLMNGSTEVLKEYDINYYNSTTLTSGHYGSTVNYDRSRFNSTQNAGFTCVNPSGMRYVYALPAYNQTEEEIAYTVDGSGYSENTNFISTPDISSYKVTNTDQFKTRAITPAYAHAYLLTSVLGADYVDADATPGPSDGDYGYWVKFNYVQTQSNYKWRAPYNGGMYLRGKDIPADDDKVMFNYGEKEIWNLASAETKSHIAVFKLSARKDGRGANDRYTAGVGSQELYKLDEINLYSKTDYATASPLVPLKTVHFDYTYDLCGSVPNNSGSNVGTSYYSGIDRNANHGKLTLKKVWFTYQNNTRGELSPYVFDYHERNSNGTIKTDENPNFSYDSYDRWGNYKESSDFFRAKNLPYVTQFDPGADQNQLNKDGLKAVADRNAAVWTLKKITLPTGGSIEMDYEADDYAYVQHRQATQMFQIERMSDAAEPSKVYGSGWDGHHTDKSLRQVYFRLEHPIPVSDANPKQKIYDNYLAGLRQADGNLQMYFRIKSILRDNLKEIVTGYCNLDEDESTDYNVDPASAETIDGVSCYTVGYVTLKLTEGANTAISDKGPIEYHPFAVAAWQFMRINEPELLTAYGKLGTAPEGSSPMDKAMKVASLLSVIPAAIQMFIGYRKYAYNHFWAKNIDLGQSFIRLATPDRAKFGGGLRVKRITYNDNWASSASGESSNSYGQVYDYTITEGSGSSAVTYSSGVAQYEPLIGGDEIALRHAKTYMQTIPIFTDNNLFYEYPINESYYPGASVGYSKVTVQSIASSRTSAGTGDLDPHIPTTGIVEYQFYTAKDFPVITDETDIQPRKYDLFVPIPLLGQMTTNKLYATQGYAITLNDMNGKLKSITNYSKNSDGEKNPIPVSSVRYEYKSTIRQFDGQTVNVLDNTVPAIVEEFIDKNASNSTYNKTICNKKAAVIMGEEYDFFVDSRQSHVLSIQGGLSVNIEFAYPFAPIPCPWPSIASSVKNLKTLATNKVINKSGILMKTIATDGQSTVTTENKLFDAQTGTPLLTTVTNDFDKPVYNYNHPAYWEYDGMGAAANNFNYSFYGKIKTTNSSNNTFIIYNETGNPVTKNRPTATFPFAIAPADCYNTLVEGDEFIISEITDNNPDPRIATLIKKSKTYDATCGIVYNLTFHNSIALSAGSHVGVNDIYKFTVVRSGGRNNLNTNIGSITALKDPTDDANRGLYTAPASSSTSNISYELADLFNSILVWGCNSNPLCNKLPITTINIGGEEYYDQNGKSLYPLISNMFNYIKIVESDSCEGYDLEFLYIDENGSCQVQTCYCIAPKFPDSYFTQYSFQGQPDGGLLVFYSGSDGGGATYGGYSTSTCFVTPVSPKYTYIDDVISSSSVLFRHLWDYDGEANNGTSGQANLYALGKKGIWKPYRNYYYKDERVNQVLSADVKLSHDGVYKGTGTITIPNTTTPLNEFYLFKWNPTVERPLYASWLPNSLVSMYDKNSNAVQTRDIVDLYSSVVYGYNSQLPIIQGNNARQKELFCENFDDPSSVYADAGEWPTIAGAISSTIAHTGKKSLAAQGDGFQFDIPLSINNDIKYYTLSLWVSRNIQPATYKGGADVIGAYMVFYDAARTPIGVSDFIEPAGNVIEKWQRIEGPVTIPSGTVFTAIKFQTNVDGVGNPITYIDDIRVFPTKSNVSTSVYDPNNFRISAVLDANNFATFYQYDEEGKLFMVKKETLDGIKAIKEERGHIKE